MIYDGSMWRKQGGKEARREGKRSGVLCLFTPHSSSHVMSLHSVQYFHSSFDWLTLLLKRLRACMYAHTYECTEAWMYVCMYTCMYACKFRKYTDKHSSTLSILSLSLERVSSSFFTSCWHCVLMRLLSIRCRLTYQDVKISKNAWILALYFKTSRIARVEVFS